MKSKKAKRSAKPRRRRRSPTISKNLPTYSEDGVDLTLIRWMLSFTPAERLSVLQQNINAIAQLRNANPAL